MDQSVPCGVMSDIHILAIGEVGKSQTCQYIGEFSLVSFSLYYSYVYNELSGTLNFHFQINIYLVFLYVKLTKTVDLFVEFNLCQPLLYS